MNETEEVWAWEQTLWDELERCSGPERIVAAGEAIHRMSAHVLVELGRFRRLQTLELVDSGEYTPEELADQMGSRVTSVRRLIDEGRTLRKQEQRHAA